MIYDFLLAICFLFFGAVQTFDLTCLGCCTCTYCDSGTAQGTYYVHGLTGITNGTCSTCNVYNTDPMELTQVGSSCVWTGDNTGGCSGGTPTLTINSDGSATFTAGGATYTVASFDCEGDNTFTLDSEGTDCEDWPPEIEIGGGEITIGCCGNTLPRQLTATITAENSPDCDCADGTQITLTWDGSKWAGSGTLGSCGQSLGIELTCNGSDVGDFELNLSGCVTSGPFIPVGATCSPLSLPFVGSSVGITCCGTAGPTSVLITVTE